MRAPVSVVLFSVCAAAQTVWNVPAPDIQAVIQQANPGDVLVLTNATYRPFTLSKGLTIVGAATPISDLFTSSQPGYITINIPPGEVANLIGLDCTYGPSSLGNIGNSDAPIVQGIHGIIICILVGTIPTFFNIIT